MGVARTARQSSELSIAEEVMPAKREMKILSTKKEGNVGIGPKDVDNFPIFTENSEPGNFEVSGQVIIEFTFQN